MPIIIDGWNFIRNRCSDISDDACDALESARALMLYLADFQKNHNDPITVVFDSAREFLDVGHKGSAKLKMVPAKDADSYIKRFIEKIPDRQRRNVRVVSSDKEIFYYAKSLYAVPIRCEDFWEKLKSDGRSRGEFEEDEDRS